MHLSFFWRLLLLLSCTTGSGRFIFRFFDLDIDGLPAVGVGRVCDVSLRVQLVVDYWRMRRDSTVVEHGVGRDLVVLYYRLSCDLTSADVRLRSHLIVRHWRMRSYIVVLDRGLGAERRRRRLHCACARTSSAIFWDAIEPGFVFGGHAFPSVLMAP